LKTHIRIDRVIDGSGRDPFGPATVVVEDGLITGIHQQPVRPDQGTTVVDLPGCTLLPGYMDAHVHVTGVNSKGPVPPAPDLAYRTLSSCQSALRHGVTTIRDVGSYHGIPVALRRAIARKHLVGPRLVCCAKLVAMTGGHAYQLGTQADGVVAVVAAIREQVRDGADFIKAVTTHRAALPEFTQEELDALVGEAHRLNRKVSCHAGIEPGVMMAVQAGVDSVEHGWIASEETLLAMKERGTALVPTLSVTNWAFDWPNDPVITPAREAAIRLMNLDNIDILADMKGYSEGTRRRLPEVVKRARELGIMICAGTDAPLLDLPYHAVVYEMELLVKFGLTTLEAISAATHNNAKLFAIDHLVGKVEAGLAADLVAVQGNPADDIRDARNVCWVMRDGAIVPDVEPTVAFR
jgi:imidazolonepropionase-like amidohydrolase